MKVIIAGGGIGGLSLALSLHQIGIESYVFESSPVIEFLGLGINLQANAVRELTELGLGEELEREAIPTCELAYYNRHGQLIWSEPRGLAAGYRWPQYSISRGALQRILLKAVLEQLGEDRLLVGHHLASFEQRHDKVTARFIDRKMGREIASWDGDILVGADGLHSAVRKKFYPGDQPHFEGMVNFRGVVETEPFLSGKTMVIVGHRDQRLIAYPINRQSYERGRALVNWICVARMSKTVLPREEWGREADREKFLPNYADWVFPWLDAPKIIEATPNVWEFPDVDRDPIPRWSFGRITMLGDAAHPMLPVGAQAGSQAIVDARALTGALLNSHDAEEALKLYEKQRIDAMNGMILRNRNLGPETVMALAEERAPQGFEKITDVISEAELEKASVSFKAAAGFDVETVNSRPSFVPTEGRRIRQS
jgi:2-polyprenyl-6-methoxyphenol hydroxylase-like FAD-dependent oxidoreductase